MRDILLPDIFAFLKEQHPELGRPSMIFLGGSQAYDSGRHVTSNSDYDVLVIFPEVEYPESFTFSSANGTRIYDLILRDKPSLTYDVLQAKNNGKGTLLHLAAKGVSIFDPDHQAAQLQSLLEYHHSAGPDYIHGNDAEDEINALSLNLIHHTNAYHTEPGLAAISNRIAKISLRLTSHWTSSGKIAGRFLLESEPQLCFKLRESFHTAAKTGDISPFFEFTDRILPALYEQGSRQGLPVAEPIRDYPYEVAPNNLAEATTGARVSLDAFAIYLHSGNPHARDAASTWAHTKLNNLTKPLTTDRFSKKPDEYFFALGRAISGYAEVDCALHRPHSLRHLSMVDRIHESIESHPALSVAFQSALAAQSQALTQEFQILLKEIQYPPLPYLHRPSPANFKADPALLIPDHFVL